MAEGTGKFIIIGILIILIITGVVFYFKLDRFRDFFTREDTIPEPTVFAEMSLFARDKDNKLISVSYQIIDNSSRILQRGKLKAGVVERFRDLKENRSYSLKGFGNGYYENTQKCPLYADQCTVKLERIANIYLRSIRIKDSLSYGLIRIENGIFIDPLICVRWQNLISFSINMTTFNVPVQYYNEYDKCYAFERNLTEGLELFEIKHDITFDSTNSFELYLIDKCNDKYVREECAPTYNIQKII